jgi:hypothetical protein
MATCAKNRVPGVAMRQGGDTPRGRAQHTVLADPVRLERRAARLFGGLHLRQAGGARIGLGDEHGRGPAQHFVRRVAEQRLCAAVP